MYSLSKNEYRIFKPIETTIRGDSGRKKKNRDEPIWVITHTHHTHTHTHGNVTKIFPV
jgi:hypothetical protein